MSLPTPGSTYEVVAKDDRAYFHKDRVKKGTPRVLRYTLCVAGLVGGAAPGDVVDADLALKFTARNFFDVRFPGEKVPGGCQVNVLFRVAPAYPDQAVQDLPPSKTTSLGLRTDDGRVFVRDYGDDMTAGGTFLDKVSKEFLKVGNPYWTETRTAKFTVRPEMVGPEGLWLLAWAAPESEGADGTCWLDVPGTSNYSLLDWLHYKSQAPYVGGRTGGPAPRARKRGRRA